MSLTGTKFPKIFPKLNKTSGLISFIILLLGLKNPSGAIDSFLSFTLFSFVIFKISSTKPFQATALVIAALTYLHKDVTLSTSIVIGLAVGFGLNTVFKKTKPIYIILALFIFTSVYSSQPILDYLNTPPQPNTYRTDMDDFLRTFYLTKTNNQGYYQNYKTAIKQNAFKSQPPQDVWSWRSPLIFYIWQLIPTQKGAGIYYLFLLLAASAIYSSYKITNNNLLTPYLLVPYFLFASTTNSLLQTEWWAIFFAILAIFKFTQNKHYQAILFFTLAILTRELIAVPIFFAVLGLLLTKSKSAKLYLIPLIAGFIFLFIHSYNVSQVVTLAKQPFAFRFHSLGNKIFLASLAFGSWGYIFYWARIFLILYLLSFLNLFKKITSTNIWLFGFVLFPLTFFVIGSSIHNDYWGIFYIPMVLITASMLPSLKNRFY